MKRNGPDLPSPCWDGTLLALVIVGYYGTMNLLYFWKYGWLSSPGPDPWFYLLVARGEEHLNPMDLTRWLVAPAAWLSTENAFAFLVVLSALLHLASTLLVYHSLGRLPGFESRRNRLLFSLVFALLPHNASLATASFTHFSVAQPFLILALARLLPWCAQREARPDPWGLLGLAESMVIGPEGFFAAFVLGCMILSTRARNRQRLVLPAAGILLLLAVALGFEPIFTVWNRLVMHFRGIDLLWQRSIASGDLLAPGWRIFSLSDCFYLPWGFLALYAVWKKRGVMAFILGFFLVLTFHVYRAAFALQLAGFASLALLAAADFQRLRTATMALIPALVFLNGISPKAPVYPPHMIRMAREIKARAKQGQIIACSPTYGFLLRAWTGLRVTDDMHHHSDLWLRLISSGPEKTNRRMLEKNIGFLLLTSHDFHFDLNGYWSTSGLGPVLQRLPDHQFQQSVAVLLARNSPLLFPLEILTRTSDPSRGQEAVCLVPAPSLPSNAPSISPLP